MIKDWHLFYKGSAYSFYYNCVQMKLFKNFDYLPWSSLMNIHIFLRWYIPLWCVYIKVQETPWHAWACIEVRQKYSSKPYGTLPQKEVGGQHHILATFALGKTQYPSYRRPGGHQGWYRQHIKSRLHQDSIPRMRINNRLIKRLSITFVVNKI